MKRHQVWNGTEVEMLKYGLNMPEVERIETEKG